MTDLPVLTPEEQRVLGSLLEKQVTVPATYPLTLNALRTACNQSNSREPVTDYDEQTVERTGRALKDRGLLRIVWADTGRRTLKYHQVLDEVLGLEEDERAALTILLLRGPTAPGALRTRAERLHAFADRDQVEATLRRMGARGLVRELPRRGGDRDNRWTHLLGTEPAADQDGAAAPATDVLAGGSEARDARVRSTYDAVAGAYAERFADELAGLPFERWLLDRVAAHATDPRTGGPVVEVGCGPGGVTAHLAAAGVDATGLDLSPAMVEVARQRFPSGSYEVGDLRRLMRPASAAGWSAVLAWYSLIHLAPGELAPAVEALVRPLAPAGLLVVALHAATPQGPSVRHLDEWLGHPVDLDFLLHETTSVVGALEGAGLVDLEWYRRGALAHRGETSERLYLVGRRPS